MLAFIGTVLTLSKPRNNFSRTISQYQKRCLPWRLGSGPDQDQGSVSEPYVGLEPWVIPVVTLGSKDASDPQQVTLQLTAMVLCPTVRWFIQPLCTHLRSGDKSSTYLGDLL